MTGLGALLCVLALAITCGLGVSHAEANQTMDAPTTVSDDVTRLRVDKLDADTHEYVQGASMQIIEKDSGDVVEEWTTGSASHETIKRLDVGTVYILREVEAPEGYAKISDVEFVVKETEGEGIELLTTSEDADLTESYKLNLYDKSVAVEDEMVADTQEETKDKDTSSDKVRDKKKTTRTNTVTRTTTSTGDTALFGIVGGLVLLAAIVAAIAFVKTRRRQ